MTAPRSVAEARAVVRSLEHAARELQNVRANTSDPRVDASAELAHKSVQTALRRARLVSKDLDLKNAEQPGLGLEGGTDVV